MYMNYLLNQEIITECFVYRSNRHASFAYETLPIYFSIAAPRIDPAIQKRQRNAPLARASVGGRADSSLLSNCGMDFERIYLRLIYHRRRPFRQLLLVLPHRTRSEGIILKRW